LVIKLKKPLYGSILAAIAGTILLFGIDPLQAVKIMGLACISPVTVSLVMAFYTITFLQRMLEKRKQLIRAEEALSGIFNSRRINAMLAPFIIGLLPSAGAVIIACPIVDNAGGDHIDKDDKTFITSYYRHISEAFMPTYSSIILALELSGVDMTAFVVAMLPMAAVLFFLGYVYVRKIPKETGLPDSTNKLADTVNLARSLWTIALTIVLILVLKIQVYTAVCVSIILYAISGKFSWLEFGPMFRSAFETKLIFSTVTIMMFKDVLTHTGVIGRLPETFAVLPVPTIVIFALVVLVGTIIAGASAMIALCIPLAFATIPDGGLALMIFLMCMIFSAMQVSPTHICLAIVTECFGTSFISLVKRTIPVIAVFMVIFSGYSYLLFIYR
jgi:integral membrane protein (TIGR00529 family)